MCFSEIHMHVQVENLPSICHGRHYNRLVLANVEAYFYFYPCADRPNYVTLSRTFYGCPIRALARNNFITREISMDLFCMLVVVSPKQSSRWRRSFAASQHDKFMRDLLDI